MRYDPDNGQAVSASFMDYAMPRAEHMPDIRDAVHIVPAATNPLGVKGVGEAGTTASIAAILNAIRDAIPGEAGASTCRRRRRRCGPRCRRGRMPDLHLSPLAGERSTPTQGRARRQVYAACVDLAAMRVG